MGRPEKVRKPAGRPREPAKKAPEKAEENFLVRYVEGMNEDDARVLEELAEMDKKLGE